MPFADELLGVSAAHTLAEALRAADPSNPFLAVGAASERFPDLALRERSDLLRDALLDDVPGPYAGLARVVRDAAQSTPDFTGWMIWPVTSAVAVRAVQEDAQGDARAFDDGLALLAELTGRLTAEWAVRVPLRHDLTRSLETALAWTSSPDEHVRRLASEGTRTYLPWGVRVPALTAQPGITLPILEALRRDGSDYVRRSVANHLNDLSRDAPELVVETARRWLAEPESTTPGLVRHALRTLVKRGHPDALALLGFHAPTVAVDDLEVAPGAVPFGGELRFGATIRNTGDAPARFAIDYVMHHQKSNGRLSPKTFKLTTCTLAPGEAVTVSRTHSFRAITTRRYHPGPHALAIQVNGVATDALPFELLAPETG